MDFTLCCIFLPYALIHPVLSVLNHLPCDLAPSFFSKVSLNLSPLLRLLGWLHCEYPWLQLVTLTHFPRKLSYLILSTLLMCISTNSLISHIVPQWQDSLVKPMSWTPGTERHTEGDGAEGGEKLPIDGGRIELMYSFPYLPKFQYK